MIHVLPCFIFEEEAEIYKFCFHFSYSFPNLNSAYIPNWKNHRLTTAFWLYHHGVKFALFQCYGHILLTFFKPYIEHCNFDQFQIWFWKWYRNMTWLGFSHCITNTLNLQCMSHVTLACTWWWLIQSQCGNWQIFLSPRFYVKSISLNSKLHTIGIFINSRCSILCFWWNCSLYQFQFSYLKHKNKKCYFMIPSKW